VLYWSIVLLFQLQNCKSLLKIEKGIIECKESHLGFDCVDRGGDVLSFGVFVVYGLYELWGVKQEGFRVRIC